jgi:hypothetical protein
MKSHPLFRIERKEDKLSSPLLRTKEKWEIKVLSFIYLHILNTCSHTYIQQKIKLIKAQCCLLLPLKHQYCKSLRYNLNPLQVQTDAYLRATLSNITYAKI